MGNQMNRDEWLDYLTGGNVTVGTVSQVMDGSIKTSYVAKIRGVIVSPPSKNYLHDTPEAAREYGQAVMAKWKAEKNEF